MTGRRGREDSANLSGRTVVSPLVRAYTGPWNKAGGGHVSPPGGRRFQLVALV